MSEDHHDSDRAIVALHTTAQSFMESERAEQVAEIAVDAIQNILGLPYNGVFLYDEEEHHLRPVAWSAEGEALVGEIPVFTPGDSLAWHVFETGQSQMYADVSLAPDRFNPDTSVGGEIIVPLDDRGVLLIGSDETDAFDEVDESLAQIVASHMTTALNRIEQEEELRRKNERLDEFVGIVSHDIRNPLNIAKGRIQLASEECDNDHLGHAADAIDRSIELFDELQRLARQGEQASSQSSISVAETTELCWQNVVTGGARLDLPSERTIRADESRLKQLVENLFRNAIQHAGEDVTVTVGDLEDGFFVEDDGPGIPPDVREQVFESGYSTHERGTGYGLPIVERVADAHGWEVRISEGADGGARFEITGVETA